VSNLWIFQNIQILFFPFFRIHGLDTIKISEGALPSPPPCPSWSRQRRPTEREENKQTKKKMENINFILSLCENLSPFVGWHFFILFQQNVLVIQTKDNNNNIQKLWNNSGCIV
jgi:hypothetical protein